MPVDGEALYGLWLNRGVVGQIHTANFVNSLLQAVAVMMGDVPTEAIYTVLVDGRRDILDSLEFKDKLKNVGVATGDAFKELTQEFLAKHGIKS